MKTHTENLPYKVEQTSTREFFTSISDNYNCHVDAFIAWLKDREVNAAAIRDYFIWLNEHSGYAPNTIKIRRAAVKNRMYKMARGLSGAERQKIFDFLYDLDHTGETSPPKENNGAIGKRKYLEWPDVRKLYQSARTPRQMAFIRFLAGTGCRINELTNIKLSDVQQIGDTFHVRIKGKGNKTRYLEVNQELYEFCRDIFRGETWLFERQSGKKYDNAYISNQIARLGKKFLNRKISAHSLRHSFATRWIAAGKPVDALSDYLGHSSPAVTLSMYCHNTASKEDLSDMDIG